MLNQTLIREADRKTFLRKIAYESALLHSRFGRMFVASYIHAGSDGSRGNTFSSFWIAYLMVGMHLFDSREWDTWPFVGMVMFVALLITGGRVFLQLVNSGSVYRCGRSSLPVYVQILRYRYGAKYCEQDVDAIAASLGPPLGRSTTLADEREDQDWQTGRDDQTVSRRTSQVRGMKLTKPWMPGAALSWS